MTAQTSPSQGANSTATGRAPMTILIYSDDRAMREQMRLLLGRRPAPELPDVQIVECATEPAVQRAMAAGNVDLVLLDGEATPAGGMGICRGLKSEIFRCPPVAVLIARPQDAWLASWSMADETILTPLDPLEFPQAVAGLLRQRLGAATTPA